MTAADANLNGWCGPNENERGFGWAVVGGAGEARPSAASE